MSEDTIWESTVDDGRYHASVVQQPGEKAHLVLREGDEVLLDEVVSLAYGAIFGPDVDDVAQWQERVIEVIDSV